MTITIISGIISGFLSYQYFWEPHFREAWLESEIDRGFWSAVLSGFLVMLIVEGFFNQRFTLEGLKNKKNWSSFAGIFFLLFLLIWRLLFPE